MTCVDWCGSAEGTNLFVSGSHDSLVKMWDIRYGKRSTECDTDLDPLREMTLFESILTTFVSKLCFLRQLGQ